MVRSMVKVALIVCAAMALWAPELAAAGPSAVPSPKASATGPSAKASASAEAETPEAEETAAPAKLTPAQRQFADAFVKAVNTADTNAMRKLIAPKSLSCLDKSSEAYLEHWLKKQMRFRISEDFRSSFAPLKSGPGTSPPMAGYPVNPTDTMEIKFGAGPDRNITLLHQVTTDNGKFYLIAPCPTAKGLERFAKFEKRRSESRERAQQIYAKLEDPLLTRLRTLIKHGKTGDAIKLCAGSLKVDNMTAADVVALLMGHKPG